MQIRLLICEDEDLMVRLLTEFMRPICSFITATNNLADALAMAKSGGFNLVLLDLKLAKTDHTEETGKAEAFHAIRQIKSYNSAVIVISGAVDVHLKEDAMAAGADGFLPKGPDFNSSALLMAANVAVLHLPHDSFKGDSFSASINLLKQVVEAA